MMSQDDHLLLHRTDCGSPKPDRVQSAMAGEEALEFIQQILRVPPVLGSRDASLNHGDNIMDSILVA